MDAKAGPAAQRPPGRARDGRPARIRRGSASVLSHGERMRATRGSARSGARVRSTARAKLGIRRAPARMTQDEPDGGRLSRQVAGPSASPRATASTSGGRTVTPSAASRRSSRRPGQQRTSREEQHGPSKAMVTAAHARAWDMIPAHTAVDREVVMASAQDCEGRVVRLPGGGPGGGRRTHGVHRPT